MKFLSLFVTAIAAVKISQEDNEVEQIFNHVDSNNNGQISPRELRRALREYAAHENYTITRADRRWVRRAARRADRDGSHSLDLPEFERFVRAFVRHYNIQGAAQTEGGDVQAQLRAIFNHVDADGSGEISADELEDALRQYAAHENYNITPADEAWVEAAAGRADEDHNDHLNFDEFVDFVHAFVRHFGIQG